MDNCPICDTGRVITKISSAGEESYCTDCRRVVASASLGFIFTAAGDEGIIECKGPEGDPRPGFKGPGKKARCFLYTEGQSEEEAKARQKAKDSAYAFQHKKSASKIINASNIVEATGYFTGTPSSMAPPTTNTTNATQPLDFGARANPQPPAAQSAAGMTPTTGGSVVGGGVPAAPGGIQPGNLNSSNPLNSGTTASKRLAELISKEMGPRFCTRHMSYDCGCNLDDKLQQ